MADHSKPTTASTYANYTAELDGRLDDLSVGLDPAVVTATNVPTNSIRWTSATARWQKYNGASWADLSTAYQIAITGNAGTATTLATARNINSVSFNGSTDIVVEPYVEQDLNTAATRYLTFVDSSTASFQRLNLDTDLAYNPNTNTLSVPNLAGNAATATTAAACSGNAATSTLATTATNATNMAVVNDTTTNATYYPVFGSASTGNVAHTVASTKLTFNPATGQLAAVTFAGAGAGLTGTAASLTAGNATNAANLGGVAASGYARSGANTDITSLDGIAVGMGGGSLSTNTRYGNGAFTANTTGYNSTATGFNCMAGNTTGGGCSGYGAYSLYRNTTGTGNTAAGVNSLRENTTGNNNTAFGLSALDSVTTGGENTAVGTSAGLNITIGTNNVAVGNSAMSSCVAAFYNVAVGNAALTNGGSAQNCVAIGHGALTNSTGYGNTAIGYASMDLANNTGGGNVAVGSNTLRRATSGGNVAIGSDALTACTTGSMNTAVGCDALRNLTTGRGNISISPYGITGWYAPVFNSTTHDCRLSMGHTEITNAYVQVAWTVVSDARDKTNFASVPHGLSFVNALKPTAYQFKVSRDDDTPNGPVRYGFKAQDVLALEGDNPVIIDNEDPEKLRMVDQHLIAVIVNAVQELSATVNAQAARIKALEARP